MTNGSERTPEHPTGTDYETLVRALRGAGPVDDFGLRQSAADAVEALLAMEQRLTDHIVQLAAERDALQAENAQLQVYLSENRRALDDAINVANGNKSARDALQAENEKLREVARVAVRRLEKAAQYCGDPQHPLWDGGRVSPEARRRVDGLIDILDPFRPELENVDDEHWDQVYKLEPIDAFVSDHEERMQARAVALAAERDALQAQLDAVRKYVRRVPFPKADKVLAILDPAEHHTKVEDQ